MFCSSCFTADKNKKNRLSKGTLERRVRNGQKRLGPGILIRFRVLWTTFCRERSRYSQGSLTARVSFPAFMDFIHFLCLGNFSGKHQVWMPSCPLTWNPQSSSPQSGSFPWTGGNLCYDIQSTRKAEVRGESPAGGGKKEDTASPEGPTPPLVEGLASASLSFQVGRGGRPLTKGFRES